MRAIWRQRQAGGEIREPHVPYGSLMQWEPYESRMRRVGAIC
jgi:hypothetical protein